MDVFQVVVEDVFHQFGRFRGNGLIKLLVQVGGLAGDGGADDSVYGIGQVRHQTLHQAVDQFLLRQAEYRAVARYALRV